MVQSEIKDWELIGYCSVACEHNGHSNGVKVRCFFLLLQMFHSEIENLKKSKWNSIVNFF